MRRARVRRGGCAARRGAGARQGRRVTLPDAVGTYDWAQPISPASARGPTQQGAFLVSARLEPDGNVTGIEIVGTYYLQRHMLQLVC